MRRYIGSRIKSFGYAFKGVRTLIASQPHARIHLMATVLVVGLGFYFEVTRMEWVSLALAMGLVWMGEAVNTAVEFVVDLVSPDHHPLAGKAKDVAAGAVLLAAIAAAVVGGLVFGPYFLALGGEATN